jgi:hypothetical protein
MKSVLFVLTAPVTLSVFSFGQNNFVGKWTGETKGLGGPQMMTLG